MLILPQSLRNKFWGTSPTNQQNAAKTSVSKLGQVANPDYGSTRPTTVQHTAELIGARTAQPTPAAQPKKAAAPKTEEAPKKSFLGRLGDRLDSYGRCISYVDIELNVPIVGWAIIIVGGLLSPLYFIGAAGYEAYQSFKN